MLDTAPVMQQRNTLIATGELDSSRAITVVHLPDGRAVHVPTVLLFESAEQSLPAPAAYSGSDANDIVVVPIVEEQLQVGKREIETGKVTLQKHVHEYEETLDVPLAARSFDIERIVVNRPVDAAPAVRHEGATTIYPILEEQLILTTQLILKEELHVTQRDTERRDTRTVTLQRESIEVTRTPLT